MLYVHNMSCISPQKTFSEIDLKTLMLSSGNILRAIEPSYESIPAGQLRRMGRAVRIGIGAALPLIKNGIVADGIIIGTANGGMEDCIKFLNQIIEYDEGVLTPTNFVQSTTNAIASQVAFLIKNKGYNITHVHRGLSFENALQDAMMLALESPEKQFLLGAVDEISDYNFNIDFLNNCFKSEETLNSKLYDKSTNGTIAGEGAAMFIVSGLKKNSSARIVACHTLQSRDDSEVVEMFKEFLKTNKLENSDVDVFMSGENGDNRLDKFYHGIESRLSEKTLITRFKHASGEMPTASAIGFWYACQFLNSTAIPEHMIKKGVTPYVVKSIVMYNCYQGLQHSFVLLQRD